MPGTPIKEAGAANKMVSVFLLLVQSPGQPGELCREMMRILFYKEGNEVHSCDWPTLMLGEDVCVLLGEKDYL